ncbi:hypothetical protein ACFPER_05265 [Agromyces aurantiacus]|uniref:DUF2029 domain-containing protein n=1 Tax=Agromyces aurantiacus TaxID=165814 RepID=A0ABV9R2Y5_9MICO|nr:hypothetical protein [Agromyces aurantiacus]MBM7502870.1 hypothetical protein [Agromyces aurantiacus]
MQNTTSDATAQRTVGSSASRRLALAGTVIAIAVLAAALVWLVAPDSGPYAAGRSPLERILGGPSPAASFAAAGLLAIASAATAAIGVGVLARRMADGRPVAVVALLAASTVALGLVGFEGIVIAGYSLAFLLPTGILVLIALMAVRRPLVAAVLGVAAGLVVVLSAVGAFPITGFWIRFVVEIARDPVRFGTSVVLIAFVGVWMLWAALGLMRRPGVAAAFAERHRVAITVAAAACAAPYVLARASWLTPWPLFGGSADLFTAHPDIRVVGLMLGAAMLVGAVLTLGLVLPWGTSVPRWVPRVGGAPLPAPLAVVPASVVAVLFTAGGVESLILVGAGSLSPELVLVLPFWLWGPLLALATLGYARHRAQATAP